MTQQDVQKAVEMAKAELLVRICQYCTEYCYKTCMWLHETHEIIFTSYNGNLCSSFSMVTDLDFEFQEIFKLFVAYFHSEDVQIYVEFLSNKEIITRINNDLNLGRVFFHFEPWEVDPSNTEIREILEILGVKSWFYYSEKLNQTFFVVCRTKSSRLGI